MKHEEMEKINSDFYSGLKMMIEKLEKVSKEKTLTLCEIGCIADIMKDLSKTHKNIVKVHYMLMEKPVERY